jgi:predicted RNA binding protein YcfA (HicA-like mRNA interferase family)
VDREERRRRIAQHPNSVSLSELQQFLQDYGWVLDRTSSSHFIFERGSQTLTVPFRRPHVLPIYVKRVLKLIAEQDGDDDGDR